VADLALLGARAAGFAGDGVVAVVRFRALATGHPEVGLAAVEARDGSNHPVPVATSALRDEPASPTITALSRAFPNPFRGTTAIGFSLAQAGPVTVELFGVDGRRVRTLARGPWEPGVWRLEWDGRDERGNTVAPGVYFVRLTTGQGRFTKAITNLR
jgi:hypothetical protein